jgi:hypothetical protein
MKCNFQSFWSGKTLTPYETLCLRSFIDRGHMFDLYTFDSGLRVPAGVRIRDAAEILGAEEFFVYEEGTGKGSPAAFSNRFRYELLVRKGGWWVDTDVICLRDDIPVFPEFYAAEDETLVNVAVLFFEPQHPLMIACADAARRMGRRVRWGDSGPFLFTRLLNERGYRDRIASSELCYPVHHYYASDILRPSRCADLRERTKSSLFVHLYNGSLLLRGVEKSKAPPRGSMLDFWLGEHPVGGWDGAYDEETVERTLLPP